MSTIKSIFLLLACIIMIFSPAISAASNTTVGVVPPIEACRAVQNALDGLVNMIDRLAEDMAGNPLDGEDAHRLLLRAYESNPVLFSIVTIGRNFKLYAVEPALFSNAVGNETGTPAHVNKAFSSGKVELSESFAAAEGFTSCAVTKTIRGGRGAVSATFNPSDIFANAVPPAYKLSVFILRAGDGVMEFSNHAENMNRSVLNDPKFTRHYPDFQKLCYKILKEENGTGTYHYKKFPTTEIVLKNCSWDTVSCGERTWRVIQFHEK